MCYSFAGHMTTKGGWVPWKDAFWLSPSLHVDLNSGFPFNHFFFFSLRKQQYILEAPCHGYMPALLCEASHSSWFYFISFWNCLQWLVYGQQAQTKSCRCIKPTNILKEAWGICNVILTSCTRGQEREEFQH